METFDVVINVGPNDEDIIHEQLKYTRENIVGRSRIFLISPNPELVVEGTTVISESMFPFSIQDLEKYFGASKRKGWYIQQLFKLYASQAIPDLSPRYLCLDADTFFLKPTVFIDSRKRSLHTVSEENHAPYMVHMMKMHPDLRKMSIYSGIVHHMMFETRFIHELFELIEEYNKKPFWEVFLENVDITESSSASEYEIYFNFMIKHHPEAIQRRLLQWKNAKELAVDDGYNFISIHWHFRKPEGSEDSPTVVTGV